MADIAGKEIVVAVIAAVSAFAGTIGAGYLGFLNKSDEIAAKVLEVQSQHAQKGRELDIQVLTTALGVLREDPNKLQSLRGWAVDVINKVSPVPIPAEAREQLMRFALDIKVDYPFWQQMQQGVPTQVPPGGDWKYNSKPQP